MDVATSSKAITTSKIPRATKKKAQEARTDKEQPSKSNKKSPGRPRKANTRATIDNSAFKEAEQEEPRSESRYSFRSRGFYSLLRF